MNTILSLTPPHTYTSFALRTIFNDLAKGVLEGYLGLDADGTNRRVFTDIVAVIGDTPEINYEFDVLDHTGSSCCHLCNFLSYQKTEVDCRYAHTPHLQHTHSFQEVTPCIELCITVYEYSQIFIGIKSNVRNEDTPLHCTTLSM